jgi:hypothetical protein
MTFPQVTNTHKEKSMLSIVQLGQSLTLKWLTHHPPPTPPPTTNFWTDNREHREIEMEFLPPYNPTLVRKLFKI